MPPKRRSFRCLVMRTLKWASTYHGEDTAVTARKKCHHLGVNLSCVGGQVYWHLDDHPGPFSLALIDCNSTYISQQPSLHISFLSKERSGSSLSVTAEVIYGMVLWQLEQAVPKKKKKNPTCGTCFSACTPKLQLTPRFNSDWTSSCWKCSFKSDCLNCQYVIKMIKQGTGNALMATGAGKFTGNYSTCYPGLSN